MIACAALQRLERYGSLGLKRHSTEDFVSTSLKDPRRANIYALTLLSTWKEALQAVRGDDANGVADVSKAPARYTDALVYAVSFAVALTTQHVFEVGTATAAATVAGMSGSSQPAAAGTGGKTKKAAWQSSGSGCSSKGDATAASLIFTDASAQALELLTLLKEVTIAIGSGRALRSNASSDDFTKAVAHLLTSSTDLTLLLLGGVSISSGAATQEGQESQPGSSSAEQQQQQQREAILAQALVLVAATAQMLRRVQASYPINDLYHTRPCAALLKTVVNKHKQLQQRLKHVSGSSDAATEQTGRAAPALLDVLHRYIQLCARRSISGNQQQSAAAPSASASAASLFSIFSLFQRLGMLHGALGAVTALPKGFTAQLCSACEDVQYWLSQLLSSTACNRATRYVVYFREDELRLMQHNVRQTSEYALYTFATTPPVDPGLVEPLLRDGAAADSNDEATRARAALVLAQWCVSAPFFFESFCQGESWASFAQEQRRLVLLQQSRVRRGLERASRRQQRKERATKKAMHLDEEYGNRSSSVSCDSSDAASAHSSSSDSASSAGGRQQRQRGNGSGGTETASLLSLPTASHANHAGCSVCGSATSLASRVSLLSTLSQHSAASYLSFISVLRPSITAGSAAGGTGAGGSADGDGAAGAGQQMHESEDGNTNLPLILLEQLALGLHRFMEAYPAELLDRYGLRSVSWSSIARMFATVEKSLVNTTTTAGAAAGAAAAAAPRQANHFPNDQEPPQPLFNLAQDIRYNKGMGYECLGLLFAKVVAPLLDPASSRAIASTSWSPPQQHQLRRSTGEATGTEDDDGSGGGARSDGGGTQEEFFANAAAVAATVGRAVLTIDDDPATRASVEAALSRCLTAYETVAPQVVDMNLPTILRLAARTAATSAGSTTSLRASASPSSLSIVLVDFVRDITARLGRGNDLPHLVDALLQRGDFAANASATAAASAVVDGSGDKASTIRSLRAVFSLPPVRQAVMEAAGTSLDPESLLRRLSGVAAELEEDNKSSSSSSSAQDEKQVELSSTARSCRKHDDARVQRMLLALELMEALLAGVTPTCVSASAVLEHTTQLELLLSSSFMAAVEELKGVCGEALDDRRALMIQHMYTIRQCRAVTILCLQDLGTQQVHDYLRMLEDALWQLTSHVGNLVGSLTLAELQPLLRPHPARYGGSEVLAPSPSALEQLQVQLLPSSLILQRLSLARAVTVALGTHAGPAEELRDMVSYLWDCLGQGGHDADEETTPPQRRSGGVSLWLANQMTSEEWVSLVALGKEKHARSSMMALLLRSAALTSAATPETPAWLSRCLQCIPGTVLRALVDAFVSLSVDDFCDASLANSSLPSARRRLELAQRQWMALTTSLVAAYAVVGHNPYWPSVVAHTVRSVTHVARVWRKHAKERLGSAIETPAQAPHHTTAAHVFALLTRQLISLLLCTLRSEPRAAEVLRRVLLTLARESAVGSSSAAGTSVPVLSRSGMSVAYVKALTVPAASLGDLSTPTMLTTSDPTTAADGGGTPEVVAALKELTFEDEVRDVCTELFAASFVKRIFTVTDLCSDSAAEAMSVPLATATAAIRASMMTLALLYQVCVAAAQASWRAKATDGSLEALVQTPAVVFLHTLAASFHARGAARVSGSGASSDAAVDGVLAAFLEQFCAHGEEHSEQHLFVHIASAAAAGEKRRRTRDMTDAGAGDTDRAAGDSSPLRTAIVAPASALEAVEDLWCEQLRWTACTVMRLSHAADSEPSSCATALQRACLTFRQLFACMWSSAHFRKHQMSKGVGGRIGGGGSDSRRARSNGDSEPTARQSRLAGDVNAFLAAVLGSPRAPGGGSSDGATRVTGNELRNQLADFFGVPVTATDGAARGVERSRHPCDRIWMQLSSVGGEAGVCALWLLWKLQCVSAALTDRPAMVDGVEDDSQTRMRTFLGAYYDLNASVEGDAATAATTATAYTRLVTALRASPDTLRILPAEEEPPLLHEHVQDLLTRTIPGASPRASAAASSFALAAPAAAELIVHLFSVRPRLPSGQLLPHAQHLLVWLSHASSAAASLAAAGVHGAAGPSLASLCIRVCAAVAAHPAVSGASDSSALIAAWASSLPPAQQQLDACRGGWQPRNGRSTAQELLDNVWLLLLSLLEESRAPLRATAAASSAPLLREGEVVQMILLFTKTWLGQSARQQVLWSRPAMLPPLMCALFTCVMRGMESQQFSPRVLSVLASGLAAMAAHVDAATANEGDAEVDSVDGDDDEGEGVGERKAEAPASSAPATKGDERRRPQKRRLEAGTEAWVTGTATPAHVKRAALAAATSALFEVAHHYIHIFTAFSSDMDFLFTDFLRVLSQHFLPTVARPPIAHRVGVRIGSTVRSDVSFADLAYTCVGNAESKSLLRQAALRMEEEGLMDSSSAGGGIAGEGKRGSALTDGSRSIFRVA
ncbi:conserved hypothetical protein [Leishmania major strain Friedlin]|uniref:Uncharacterized protein n=1 Tax=Leishmania major TaxID=5664 RepID=Q4QIC5_LEIMA|nr:conserved hypothetical protein [Leishmania major strain Friedlin]CAG9569342.1 hypothetical_protein_-_conserved [Leishmania major strain Friedlin]CAJ02223.1 conserved hypothetical protein [Leishmania major strain Friedlin]|eukprot:XP_001681073.1 conserved hypothetical protein [Leishmania major strain Friedlin]